MTVDFVRFNEPGTALQKWASTINNESIIAEVPPCLVAAIMSRETGGQNILQHGADPHTGRLPDGSTAGVGLMQLTSGVDWSNPADPMLHGYHIFTKPAENVYVAAAYFIAPLLKSAARLQSSDPHGFARFGSGQLAYYVAAGYNEGWGAVMKRYGEGIDPDGGTTDGYATDVLHRYLDFVAESHENG